MKSANRKENSNIQYELPRFTSFAGLMKFPPCLQLGHSPKTHTVTVENINSYIRKHIAALQRKSKCFLLAGDLSSCNESFCLSLQ